MNIDLGTLQGSKLIGYGAGLATLLTLRETPLDLEFIVDDNPKSQGTDLFGIPIVSPAALDGIEVVLAGDIAYERAMAERCFEFLTDLARQSVEVYVGDLGRPYLARDLLEPLASYDVPTSFAVENAEVKRTTVFRLST